MFEQAFENIDDVAGCSIYPRKLNAWNELKKSLLHQAFSATRLSSTGPCPPKATPNCAA